MRVTILAMPLRLPFATVVAAAAWAGAGAGAASGDPGITYAALDAAGFRADTEVSSNWSGYVATGSDPAVQPSFTNVSARWVEPKAVCSTGRRTSSAFWVGLGGASDTSQALEQIGTSADCGPSGKASYSMWYELVPAASVRIKLKILPRNVVSASVAIDGTDVTLQIRNLTRKTRFTKVLSMDTPETSSAEWVAEAPSACSTFGRCFVLPLTNFGSVTFTRATATADGHMGPINDPAWLATPVELVEHDFNPFADQTAPSSGAVPSSVSLDGSAFSVAYHAS